MRIRGWHARESGLYIYTYKWNKPELIYIDTPRVRTRRQPNRSPLGPQPTACFRTAGRVQMFTIRRQRHSAKCPPLIGMLPSILCACMLLVSAAGVGRASPAGRPPTPTLLRNFASNLYEEFRHDAPSDQRQSAIRQRIGDFARDFGTHRRRRSKRETFGYRGAFLDSSKCRCLECQRDWLVLTGFYPACVYAYAFYMHTHSLYVQCGVYSIRRSPILGRLVRKCVFCCRFAHRIKTTASRPHRCSYADCIVARRDP